jgi:hypothetical protein
MLSLAEWAAVSVKRGFEKGSVSRAQIESVRCIILIFVQIWSVIRDVIQTW